MSDGIRAGRNWRKMLFQYLPKLNVFLPQKADAQQIGNIVISFTPKRCYFIFILQAKLQRINDAKYMKIYKTYT